MSWELDPPSPVPSSLTEARVVTAVTTAVENGGPDAAERAAEYIESKVSEPKPLVSPERPARGHVMKTGRKHKLSEVTFSINLPQNTADDLAALADRMESVDYPCRGYGRGSAVRELIRLGMPALLAAIQKMELTARVAVAPTVPENEAERPEPLF